MPQMEDVQEISSETVVPRTPQRKLVSQSPKKTKSTVVKSNNSRSEEAYQILQKTVATQKVRDASTIYGEHVESKHRRYSAHTQSVVEHLIGDILFNADMGRFEANSMPSPSCSTSSSGYNYQPLLRTIQQSNTFTPNATPMPSPSPTNSFGTNAYSSAQQTNWVPLDSLQSPSLSHSSDTTYSDQAVTVLQGNDTNLPSIQSSAHPQQSQQTLRNYLSTYSNE